MISFCRKPYRYCMKISCLDKTASDRIALQKYVDAAYESCRDVIGHLSLLETVPQTKDEVLFGSLPDAVVIGPKLAVEEAYAICRELGTKSDFLPVFVLLSSEAYSLRALRRFQRCSADVFAAADSPIRFIHRLCSIDSGVRSAKSGKLIVIDGVKGGVGATTIAAGLAHAAEALGQRAVVIDLSKNGVLVQYMGAERWHSADYAAALIERLSPDRKLVERCVLAAPNGVAVLLPPAGGHEARELWVRDPRAFEFTLAVVEILRDLFDAILVDIAGTEGVLPYALQTRAEVRALVTSNDPASVDLLYRRLTEVTEIPGAGHVQVLISMMNRNSLSREDVLDFLYAHEAFEEWMCSVPAIPFDASGGEWIGTGNTFYTESAKGTQAVLEQALQKLMLSREELFAFRALESASSSWLKRFAGFFRPNGRRALQGGEGSGRGADPVRGTGGRVLHKERKRIELLTPRDGEAVYERLIHPVRPGALGETSSAGDTVREDPAGVYAEEDLEEEFLDTRTGALCQPPGESSRLNVRF